MITYKSGHKIVAPFKSFKVKDGGRAVEWESAPDVYKFDERITCKRPLKISVEDIESIWQVDEVY